MRSNCFTSKPPMLWLAMNTSGFLPVKSVNLKPEEDTCGPVEERHGKAALEVEPKDRERPRLEGGILVAQRPDTDVWQVLTEPGRPMTAGCPPVIAGVAIEPMDEDHIPVSLRVITAADPHEFRHRHLDKRVKDFAHHRPRTAAGEPIVATTMWWHYASSGFDDFGRLKFRLLDYSPIIIPRVGVRISPIHDRRTVRPA